MGVFGSIYSKYYDLLYQEKDYAGEYNYIQKVIMKHGYNVVSGGRVLDIGCGTGRHLSYFRQDGFNVAGIDMSEDMIDAAKKHLGQDNDLLCCKASELNFDGKFNVIYSLFHVMSYQTETSEIESIFNKVSEYLDDGMFIFDFWYGPAVLSDPPVVRIKRIEDKEIKITRIAEPEMRYNENIVDVNYELFIEEKMTGSLAKINETHNMRYFFLPEIQYMADKAGLYMVNAYKWHEFSPLSNDTWYGLVVLKRRD